MIQTAQDYLLARKVVEQQAGISRATIYRMMKAGKFPRPVELGGGAKRWRQSDITMWQEGLSQKV